MVNYFCFSAAFATSFQAVGERGEKSIFGGLILVLFLFFPPLPILLRIVWETLFRKRGGEQGEQEEEERKEGGRKGKKFPSVFFPFLPSYFGGRQVRPGRDSPTICRRIGLRCLQRETDQGACVSLWQMRILPSDREGGGKARVKQTRKGRKELS